MNSLSIIVGSGFANCILFPFNVKLIELTGTGGASGASGASGSAWSCGGAEVEGGWGEYVDDDGEDDEKGKEKGDDDDDDEGW